MSAVEVLPDSVPEFLRQGIQEVGRSAVDPDYYRLRDLPQLRDAENPQHYLDSEYLEGAKWPETRSSYLELLADKKLNAVRVGMLPYSISERLQLLAASFAQYRLDNSDVWAQKKALYHAGVMAHYASDLCQPLHTTIHYNGRASEDFSSPESGIHRHTDGLATEIYRSGPPRTAGVTRFVDLMQAVETEFAASHALVDRVYELEDQIIREKGEPLGPEARAFASERIAASIRFTASLIVTAWELSGEIELPDWYLSLTARKVVETP